MTTPSGLSRKQTLQALKEDKNSATRHHSLYDLNADKVLQDNQVSGKLNPEWKLSKYKICGSFVENKKGERIMVPKQTNLSRPIAANHNYHGIAQQSSNSTPTVLKRTSRTPKSMLKRESFDTRDVKVQQVNNVDEVFDTKPHSKVHLQPAQTDSVNLPTIPNLIPRGPRPQMPTNQMRINRYPSNTSNLSMDMNQRQSMADFDKTMQYLNTNNPNYGASFQNMLANQTIFNSFMSNGSGSFTNLLNMNNHRRQGNNIPHLGSAENNFNIDHVREVEESESFPRQTQQNMNFKRTREYTAVSGGKKRGKWSESEDQVLQKYATTFLTRKEKINFKKISDHLAGRSAKQCREHWLSTLNPDLKKGRWTKAEEVKLLDLMVMHGKSWSVIAKQITGRAEHSVKAKGRLMLGERLKTVPSSAVAYTSSEEQKQKLLQLHKHIGNDFDEISKQCGFIVSPAKIERTLLTVCTCVFCSALNESIKETKSTNFLQGWTIVKARMIKENMEKKSSKYYQQQLLAQQQSFPTPKKAVLTIPEMGEGQV